MIRRLSTLLLLALTIVGSAAGCDSRDDALPPGLLERETFIDVYVALRMAALTADRAALPDVDRERILAEFQVSTDDLLSFAEAYGRDPDFMLEVWRDIEGRLNVPVDSSATDSN